MYYFHRSRVRPIFSKPYGTVYWNRVVCPLYNYYCRMKVVNYPLQTKPYSSVRFSSQSFQFHYIFCCFCYYLLLLPYRFEIIQNECRVRKHRVQKILCAVLHTSLLLLKTFELRRIFVGPKIVENPEKFFKIALDISLWFYCLAFIRLSCFKQENFKEIISTFSWCNDSSKGNKDKYAAIGLCLFGVLSALVHLIADYWGISHFKDVLKSAAGSIYFCLFLRENSNPLDEQALTSTAVVLAILQIISDCFLRLSNHFFETFFYISSLSVYRLTKDFLRVFQTHPNLCISKISQFYDEMKNVMNQINNVCGSFVVVMFVTGVPYFSGNFCDRFDSDVIWKKLDYLQYGILYITILVFAAEANLKMQEFLDYLIQHKKKSNQILHAEKLSILLLEQSTFPIGLKGYGFFTITFGFLGTVFSILLTYVIILLQFKMSSQQ